LAALVFVPVLLAGLEAGFFEAGLLAGFVEAFEPPGFAGVFPVVFVFGAAFDFDAAGFEGTSGLAAAGGVDAAALALPVIGFFAVGLRRGAAFSLALVRSACQSIRYLPQSSSRA
jgi:hypothetical protein